MRRVLACAIVAALVGAACGDATPAASTPRPATIVAIPTAKHADPPFVRIANAHASIDAPRAQAPTWHHSFRSQGNGAVLIGSDEGLALISAANGVRGFVTPPPGRGNVRWAGFGKNDAVLLVAGTRLFRASTLADAVAGKFAELPPVIDASMDRFASANDVLVVGASRGAYFESKDGGVTLVPGTLPANDPLSQLVVRSDGFVVAAFEVGKQPGKYGGTTVHSQAYVKPRLAAPWKKIGLFESSDEPLTLAGDAIEGILVTDNRHFEGNDGKTVALDAKGKLVRTDWVPPWIQPWPTSTFEPSPPPKRPKMPVTSNPMTDLSMLAAIGGLGAFADCRGVGCVAFRAARGPEPTSYVLDDAECDASSVVVRTTTYEDAETGKEGSSHWPGCDENKPATRSASLVVPGDGVPRTFRLPTTCAKGSLVGTDTWPIVQCEAKYGGKAIVLGLDRSGTFAELVPFAMDQKLAAERSSDGTTVLSATPKFFLCDPKAFACKDLSGRADLLAARPVDGGRALVARKGATDDEVVLSVEGAESTKLALVHVEGNLLEMSIATDGSLVLFTHAHAQSLDQQLRPSGKKLAMLRAWRVRADGSLVPDEDAAEAMMAARKR